MAVQIVGAKGSPIVESTPEGELRTAAVVETDMEKRNEKGFAWSMPFDAIDPTGANDIFLYIQNTEPTLNLHIRRIQVSSTVAGMLEVIRVTGTATGGSDVTLVNFNEGFSSKTPTGVFQTAVDITNLTDGGKYAFQPLPVADTKYDLEIPHDIILDKNGAVAFNWVPATGILTGTVWFFLHR